MDELRLGALEEDDDVLESHSEGESDDAADDNEDEKKANFDAVCRKLKTNSLALDSEQSQRDFLDKYGDCLDHAILEKSLMHVIAEVATDERLDCYKTILKLLVARHPKLLEKQDETRSTPLHVALKNKNNKLIQFICASPELAVDGLLQDDERSLDTTATTQEDRLAQYRQVAIEKLLGIQDQQSQNCIHRAVSTGSKITRYLVSRAGEDALCAIDSNGMTPLLLAVQYQRCTDNQEAIVRSLVKSCDKALDVRTRDSECLSPYQEHQRTRAIYLEKQKAESEKAQDAGVGKIKEAHSLGGKSSGGKESKDGKDGTGKTRLQQNNTTSEVARSLRRPDDDDTVRDKHKDVKPAKAGMDVESKEPVRRGPANMSLPLRRQSTQLEGRVTPSPKPKRSSKRNPTESGADAVRDFLKVHYMRTRGDNETIDFLYKGEPGRQIFFNCFGNDTLDLSKRSRETLLHQNHTSLGFEDVLRFVALPKVQRNMEHGSSQSSLAVLESHGRSEVKLLFDDLRKKNVKKVLRVHIDDLEEPAHSDEAIEDALHGLGVITWDWRKPDLCIDTIKYAAPQVEIVHLYWKGNAAILRSWSEPDGLPSLTKLKEVHIHWTRGLDGPKRTSKCLDQFRERLGMEKPTVDVTFYKEEGWQRRDMTPSGRGSAPETSEQEHKWLRCMHQFADFLQNVEVPRGPIDLSKEVTIALIDDGVNTLADNALPSRIVSGRSFDTEEGEVEGLTSGWYTSTEGHGTKMARLMCDVFPDVRLVVVKLKQRMTAENAAKAVYEAIERKVDIISMSWTIPKSADNSEGIAQLEEAIRDAAAKDILMFCAAHDQGIEADHTYPAACTTTRNIFKIGAAAASGRGIEEVDEKSVDYFLPGHNVHHRGVMSRVKDSSTMTGSSVATAIAASLAGLIIHCVRLAAIEASTSHERGKSARWADRFQKIKTHQVMRAAFSNINTNQTSQSKYLEVESLFGKALEDLDKRLEPIDIVFKVAECLMTRKTYDVEKV